MTNSRGARGGRGASNDLEGVMLGVASATVVLIVLAAWGATALAASMGAPAAPASPVGLVEDLVHGSYRWGTTATWCLAGELVMLGMAASALATLLLRRRRGRVAIKQVAQDVVREPAGLRRYTDKSSAPPGVFAGPGPVIGEVMPAGRPMLRARWEDQVVIVAGPRSGKTTAYAIPAILDAPGAVLATSNKRDLVDHTAGVLAERGRKAWVFDPQRICRQAAQEGWWWNPLSTVSDITSAGRLAAIWTDATRRPGARTDAYFDEEGQRLVALLVLAAAATGRSVLAVHGWVSDAREREPARLLGEAGLDSATRSLRAILDLPEKQRAGVYGTAARTASFLGGDQVKAWVEPGEGSRPCFDPTDFAGSTDVLYSLSQEGEGSIAPLTTALTVAVLDAALELAANSPGGRLALPLLGVLDEAANVCRWRDLPDLYSHFGSRGIVIMTILQSWAQGNLAWPDGGMQKLWDASNVQIYGGSVTDMVFLDRLSQRFGEHDVRTRSASSGGGSRQTSWSTRRDRIVPVADLAALPPHWAAVGLSGTRPVLVRTRAWMSHPAADAVRRAKALADGGSIRPAEKTKEAAL